MIQTSSAMPNFARKYGMACSSCHNPIPRLNEFGFKFRAAGFRMPDEIGKGETSNNVGDYFAGRLQARYDLKRSEAPNGTTTNSNQLTFHEVTLYPVTGAFAKNYSALVEMSFASEEPAELENAFVRYNSGTENQFFSARLGIMHPFEGYGASDRPLGLSRPLIQGSTANTNQSTLFTPWGYDQVGFELGYTVNQTAIRVTLFNGLLAEDLKNGAPAQGGGLTKTQGDPSYNSKDIQVFLTHILTDNGGGLSGYFYSGSIDLQTGLSGATHPAVFQNSFQRYAVYASYALQKALFLGGFQQGSDNSFDKVRKTSSSSFNSSGFFAEANYNMSEPLWLGLRYDQFDPSTDVSSNELQSLSAIANYSFDNGLQFIAEYQHKTSKKGAVGDQKDDAFQLRMIFIY